MARKHEQSRVHTAQSGLACVGQGSRSQLCAQAQASLGLLRCRPGRRVRRAIPAGAARCQGPVSHERIQVRVRADGLGAGSAGFPCMRNTRRGNQSAAQLIVPLRCARALPLTDIAALPIAAPQGQRVRSGSAGRPGRCCWVERHSMPASAAWLGPSKAKARLGKPHSRPLTADNATGRLTQGPAVASPPSRRASTTRCETTRHLPCLLGRAECGRCRPVRRACARGHSKAVRCPVVMCW